jgi:hypothetical protein
MERSPNLRIAESQPPLAGLTALCVRFLSFPGALLQAGMERAFGAEYSQDAFYCKAGDKENRALKARRSTAQRPCIKVMVTISIHCIPHGT